MPFSSVEQAERVSANVLAFIAKDEEQRDYLLGRIEETKAAGQTAETESHEQSLRVITAAISLFKELSAATIRYIEAMKAYQEAVDAVKAHEEAKALNAMNGNGNGNGMQ